MSKMLTKRAYAADIDCDPDDPALIEEARARLASIKNPKKRAQEQKKFEKALADYQKEKDQMERKYAMVRDPERFLKAATTFVELHMLSICTDVCISRLDDVDGWGFLKQDKRLRQAVNKWKDAQDCVLNAWLKAMETDGRFMASARKAYELEPHIYDLVCYCLDDVDKWRWQEVRKKMDELVTEQAVAARLKETEASLKVLYPAAFPDLKYDTAVAKASAEAWERINNIKDEPAK